MLQELFRIPGLDLPIYGYGVMLVVGFLLALELAKFLARRGGLDPETFVNAGLIALVAGVVGARLSHVIENWPQYTDPARSFGANFFDAVNIRSGGLTFYGGLILAFPIVIAYGIRKRVPIRLGMDIVAPCIMIGLGIGRVGCFLNGCCYGAECDQHFALAVQYPYHSNAYIDQFTRGEITAPDELILTPPGREPRLVEPSLVRKDAELSAIAKMQHSLPVHPSQLYSTFTALLIASILVCYFSLRPSPGRVMALMLMLEGATRFVLELLRAEPPVTYVFGIGWSLSMLIGVILLFAGVILWLAFADRRTIPAASPLPA
jgi:phosphatidylglycerol:prolipoprotein diacylglycerol transferase